MITALIAKIFGTNNSRQLKRIQPTVEKINNLEISIQKLSDEELAKKTEEFKERLKKGETLDEILPEAFAVVREASKRKLNQRHYDVQLIGGIVLHEGKIAEMKTGEGKTLTATLPLYLNALKGKGAHLVTVNDYLAKRDAEWMATIFNFLGMSVGIIQHNMSDQERKDAYNCDIVYGTNNEIGFDYLRDNMKFRLEDYAQRDLNFAIVDEVDSILIDEARTPLIISGPSEESSKLYRDANRAILNLNPSSDYEIDEKQKTVQLTESGNDKIEQFFGISNLYAIDNIKLLHHVNQALKANSLFKKDVEYVVKDDQVLIVDEFTGRILSGRRYSDGLHQAIEAKENVRIERESQTLASITLQNLFRLYKKLSGMTGTASTEAEEFHRIYKLEVISIPTHMPMIRVDKPDLIFFSKQAKYKAVIEDIKERYKKGQPILIGTIAIETSELLSTILSASNIPHEVLNAKNHAREADIIAHAGELNKVTIATNMAGRGTDIKLTPDSVSAGGLYIIGTERHESRRIDNQLRGRSGRQGDPGESRFYISLDDDLIRVFSGGDFTKNMMTKAGMTDEESIESDMISRTIESSQEKVEKQHFESRKYLLEYDDVLNQQRTVVYGIRRAVLESEEQIANLIEEMLSSTIEHIIRSNNNGAVISSENMNEIIIALNQMTGIEIDELKKQPFAITVNQDSLIKSLNKFLSDKFNNKLKAVTEGQLAILQHAHKWIILESIDQAWKQHMLNLDQLKEGINLRSWGQRNPLIEYKKEAFEMFEDMMHAIQFEIIQHIFQINIEHFDHEKIEEKRERELGQISMRGPEDPEGDHSHENVQAQASAQDKIGRNEDCPCGSGKKFKKCCKK